MSKLSNALATLVAVSSCAAGLASAQINMATVGGPAVYPAEFNGDVRSLSHLPSAPTSPKFYRAPLKRKQPSPLAAPLVPSAEPSRPGGPRPPMPSPIENFAGMSYTDDCGGGNTCGGGWPPDPNGDVGPSHYIEAVNLVHQHVNNET